VGDPNVPSGEVATVEHAAPLLELGTVIVPVKPLGTVLTPGDAASGKPFGPTDSPGTIPNEEVAPSGGVAVVIPAWAKAALWHNKDQAPQTANTAAQVMTFFFIMTPHREDIGGRRAAMLRHLCRSALRQALLARGYPTSVNPWFFCDQCRRLNELVCQRVSRNLKHKRSLACCG
jgi:hypothetical protein